MKTCTKCKSNKSPEDFTRRARSLDGRKPICKVCERDYQKSRAEELTAYYRNRRLNLTDEQKLEEDLKKKAWYESNKERESIRRKEYYQKNREKELAKRTEYQKNNPDKCNAVNASRKSAKLKATPKWANLDKISSVYSQAKELSKDGITYHVDHITPLKSKYVCGLHVESNLQILEASDNSSKGNRHWPDMW
jgi:hypothetical protein